MSVCGKLSYVGQWSKDYLIYSIKQMTLAQAGTTLERFGKNRKHSLPDEVKEAIDTVTALLPRVPETTSAEQRFDELCELVSRISKIDIRSKSRETKTVIWRRCIWYFLSKEGYGISAIGKASGFDHATVLFGIRKHKDYLDSGDYLTRNIWNVFSTIIVNG